MTFAAELKLKIISGFQAMSVATFERRRIANALVAFGVENKMPIIRWSPCDGLTVEYPDPTVSLEAEAAFNSLTSVIGSAIFKFDLLTTLQYIADNSGFPNRALFVINDGHEYLSEMTLEGTSRRSFLATAVSTSRFQRSGIDEDGNIKRRTRPLLFVQPGEKIHPDIDPLIEPMQFPLLTQEEIATDVIDDMIRSMPRGETGLEGEGGPRLRHQIGSACTGLLEQQVSNALASCLYHHAKFCEEMLPDIRKYRTEAINKSGLVHVYEGSETFADVIGLTKLKKFLSGISRPRPTTAIARPRGVLLLGVPGSGKSLITKALASESGRLAIELDIGSLLGGIVGQSEEQARRAFDIIDNAGPTVLLIDEVEKALAGLESSGQTDSGVMSRVFDVFLRWLNDHTSDVIVVATSNDIRRLPAEFSRAGRFDSIYFVDTPSGEDRKLLWTHYIAKYKLDVQKRPDDELWTGAEIETCTRLAELLGVPLVEAAEHVIPVALTNKERIDGLRAWAEGRCLDASIGGKYSASRRTAGAATSSAPAARSIRTKHGDPGLN